MTQYSMIIHVPCGHFESTTAKATHVEWARALLAAAYPDHVVTAHASHATTAVIVDSPEGWDVITSAGELLHRASARYSDTSPAPEITVLVPCGHLPASQKYRDSYMAWLRPQLRGAAPGYRVSTYEGDATLSVSVDDPAACDAVRSITGVLLTAELRFASFHQE